MKRSKFSEARIAFVLKQAEDGTSVGDLAGRRLAKALRPGRGRQLVDDVRSTWQVSIRRACAVLRAKRSGYHYRGKRTDQADLKQRIKEIAEARVR